MNELHHYVNEFKCLGSDCRYLLSRLDDKYRQRHEKYQKVEIDEVDNIEDYLLKNTPSSRHFLQ